MSCNKNYFLLVLCLIFCLADTSKLVRRSFGLGDMDLVKAQLGFHNHELEQFIPIRDGEISFRDIVLNGSDKKSWSLVAAHLGKSLAELHLKTSLCSLSKEQSDALQTLISKESELSSWVRVTERPSEVPEDVFDKAIESLSNVQNVIHTNFSLSNVLSPDWRIVITPALGSGISDVAQVLGDMIVQYHESVSRMNVQPIADKDRVCDVEISNMAAAFGKAYEKGMLSDEGKQGKFWAEVAPLVGLDVLRRCGQLSNESYQIQSEFGVTDCINAAKRILSNRRIENVPFMFFVGLAMG